jgi:hypothetical protein
MLSFLLPVDDDVIDLTIKVLVQKLKWTHAGTFTPGKNNKYGKQGAVHHLTNRQDCGPANRTMLERTG